jgi:hypothetical protein
MGAFAGREPRWEIAGLIADSRTEAEIAARQPPSCIVAMGRAGAQCPLHLRIDLSVEYVP